MPAPLQKVWSSQWLIITCSVCLIMFLSSCRTSGHQRLSVRLLDEDPTKPHTEQNRQSGGLIKNISGKGQISKGSEATSSESRKKTEHFVIKYKPTEVLWYAGCGSEYERTIPKQINNFASDLLDSHSSSKLGFVSCQATSWLSYRGDGQRVVVMDKMMSNDGSNILRRIKTDLGSRGDFAQFFSRDSLKALVVTVSSQSLERAHSFTTFLENTYPNGIDDFRFFGLYHLLVTEHQSIHPSYHTLQSTLGGGFMILQDTQVAWTSQLLSALTAHSMDLTYDTEHPIASIISVSVNGKALPLYQVYFRNNEIKLSTNHLTAGDKITLTYRAAAND